MTFGPEVVELLLHGCNIVVVCGGVVVAYYLQSAEKSHEVRTQHSYHYEKWPYTQINPHMLSTGTTTVSRLSPLCSTSIARLQDRCTLTNVIYRIECALCSRSYIGETKRERLMEH